MGGVGIQERWIFVSQCINIIMVESLLDLRIHHYVRLEHELIHGILLDWEVTL